jgi:hypothetical protein
MADDHVGKLRKARDELVRQRRLNISALKEDYGQNTEAQLAALIRYEQAIKAIDSAIAEEQRSVEISADALPGTSSIRYED